MENTNIILDEVRRISVVIAGIGNRHPYTVPATYFDNVAVQVMLRIALEEKLGTDPAMHISKNNVYQAPENYFEDLAGNVMKRIREQGIGAREELELLSPFLGQIENKNPFKSPEGYFNDFSDNIMAGVKAIAFVNEELENLSPVMEGLKSKQVYEAPEGYFDTTAAAILKKARQQHPGTIIKGNFQRNILRFAAAAVISGIIVLGGYRYAVKSSNTAVPELAKVSDQEIESFVNNNTLSVADTTTLAGTDGDLNDNDVKDLLANISDEELQQYVDQRPETPITN